MVRVSTLFLILLTLLFVTWFASTMKQSDPWDRGLYWVLVIPWFALFLTLWGFWRGTLHR